MHFNSVEGRRDKSRESNKRPTVLRHLLLWHLLSMNKTMAQSPTGLTLFHGAVGSASISLVFFLLKCVCVYVCVCMNAGRRKKRVLESGTGITSPCE